MNARETCHIPDCFNPVGPDGTLCELHEKLEEQGKEDAPHLPFLSPEADDGK